MTTQPAKLIREAALALSQTCSCGTSPKASERTEDDRRRGLAARGFVMISADYREESAE